MPSLGVAGQRAGLAPLANTYENLLGCRSTKYKLDKVRGAVRKHCIKNFDSILASKGAHLPTSGVLPRCHATMTAYWQWCFHSVLHGDRLDHLQAAPSSSSRSGSGSC
jgi:hypothetical protein